MTLKEVGKQIFLLQSLSFLSDRELLRLLGVKMRTLLTLKKGGVGCISVSRYLDAARAMGAQVWEMEPAVTALLDSGARLPDWLGTPEIEGIARIVVEAHKRRAEKLASRPGA